MMRRSVSCSAAFRRAFSQAGAAGSGRKSAAIGCRKREKLLAHPVDLQLEHIPANWNASETPSTARVAAETISTSSTG
jgi:hypothetical protein